MLLSYPITLSNFINTRSLVLENQMKRMLQKSFGVALRARQALRYLCYKQKMRHGAAPWFTNGYYKNSVAALGLLSSEPLEWMLSSSGFVQVLFQ